MERLEQLGISTTELASSLKASREEVERWLSGTLPPETADRFEVAFSLLEIRLGKIMTAAEAA